MQKFLLYCFLMIAFGNSAWAQQQNPFGLIKDLRQFTALPEMPNHALPPLVDVEKDLQQKIQAPLDCPCIFGCFVLPVSLIEFDANRINKSWVEVKWKTQNEINNLGFELQRSLGTPNNFEKIRFEPAQGGENSTQKYSYTDPNNFSGISYYRLLQIDTDGKINYSEIVAVKGYSETASISIYPNPIVSSLMAEIYIPEAAGAKLEIFDAAQRMVGTKNLQLLKGLNKISLAAQNLAKGMYFIRVTTHSGEVLSAKFVKN